MRRIVAIFVLFLSDGVGADLRVAGGFAVVEARVNGEGPFRLLVDTGSSSSVLRPDAARRARLQYQSRTVLETVAGESVVRVAPESMVEVGGVGMRVEVLEAEVEGTRQIVPDLDGVLGQEFLSRMPVLIDYRQRGIWFGREAERLAERMTVVGVEVEEGRVLVPVRVRGKEYDMVLDSGASHLVFECAGDCKALLEGGAVGVAMTNQGSRRVRTGRVQQVVVGGLEVGEVEGMVIESRHKGRSRGLLPAGWFEAVYVDAGRKEIRLRREVETAGE